MGRAIEILRGSKGCAARIAARIRESHRAGSAGRNPTTSHGVGRLTRRWTCNPNALIGPLRVWKLDVSRQPSLRKSGRRTKRARLTMTAAFGVFGIEKEEPNMTVSSTHPPSWLRVRSTWLITGGIAATLAGQGAFAQSE